MSIRAQFEHEPYLTMEKMDFDPIFADKVILHLGHDPRKQRKRK